MTDLSYYDIRDSQCDEIGESYLTISQFEDMFSDWYEGDKPENDLIQSDNEVNVLDMGCSESDRSERKRKSSELPMYNKVRVIETNPELNDGRAEAEKEKNPKQENQEIYEKGNENDSHKVEHKRENIDSDGSGRENQVKSK